MKKLTMASMVSLANSQRQNASENETTLNTDGSIAADWLWEKMAEIYGEQWTRESGEDASLMWKAALGKQSQESIKIGVAQTVKQGVIWPPNLPKFIELCQGEQIDTDKLFDSMLRGAEPTHAAELHTRMNTALIYSIRHDLDAKKARKAFRDEYLKNLELERAGKIEFVVVERIEQKSNIFYTEEQKKLKREELIKLGIKPRGSLAGMQSAHKGKS